VAGGLVGLALVARGRNGGMLTRAAASVDVDAGRAMLDVGGPVGAQQGVRQLLRVPIFVLVFVGGGAAGLAAYIIGARVATVAFVPPQSLQQAAQSVIGQNLGAGQAGRARRTTWLGVGVAVGALTLVGAVQWLVPETLATAFAPTLSGDGLALTAEYLTVLAYGYPALGAIYTVEAGFNAAGRSRVSFLSTLLQYGAVRLPIAAVGVLYLPVGVSAVFWAVTVSNVVAAVWLVAYYRYSVGRGMMRDAAEPVDADAGAEGAAA
jgi:Na+-driven multidrug efflux pump